MRHRGEFEISFVDRAGRSPFFLTPFRSITMLCGVSEGSGQRIEADRSTAADAFEDVFTNESDTGSLVMDVPIMSGGNGQ